MGDDLTIQGELPVVRWRDARLHVRIHMIVRDVDDQVTVTDVSESVTVDALDDGGSHPQFRVSPRGRKR